MPSTCKSSSSKVSLSSPPKKTPTGRLVVSIATAPPCGALNIFTPAEGRCGKSQTVNSQVMVITTGRREYNPEKFEKLLISSEAITRSCDQLRGPPCPK